MAYWLLKTNPELFSWDQLAQSNGTRWDGVRNYQARNYLREMKPGDMVLVFHQGDEPGAVGVARVTKEAYDDPTTTEGNWSVVEVEPVTKLSRPVSADEIRYTPVLNVLPMFNQPKLSVMPVSQPQWDLILKIGKTQLQ